MLARSRKDDFREALKETLRKLEGAFSMVMLHEKTLIAMRDPHGFRPLYLGRKGSLTAVASETCALEMLDIREYREVEPGEIILIDQRGIRTESLGRAERLGQCVFELIYFARPDSLVFDESVYMARKRMGAALAAGDADILEGLDRDSSIVVPAPTSGNTAALGYAEASGIPYEMGLTRNHYIGRSFIMPSSAERELVVKMKLSPVREVIKGKTVILIDDSLVRGTTSKILVQLLKEAGAKAVHLRLSSPEIRWPCYFGIDIPTRAELISNSLSNREIAQTLGAETVRFLPIQGLKTCMSLPDAYCTGCFSGDYPFPITHPKEI
jgi:amidophosphoribosyltransferase